MSNIRNMSDEELEHVIGGACPDKENPIVLEMWFYNPTTQREKKFSGSFPSKEAAQNQKQYLIDRYGAEGYQMKLTKIYNAFKN